MDDCTVQLNRVFKLVDDAIDAGMPALEIANLDALLDGLEKKEAGIEEGCCEDLQEGARLRTKLLNSLRTFELDVRREPAKLFERALRLGDDLDIDFPRGDTQGSAIAPALDADGGRRRRHRGIVGPFEYSDAPNTQTSPAPDQRATADHVPGTR